jgi:pheromone shutdown-related protein TraB
MDTNNRREPIVEVMLGESRVTVLGTAHVSQTSADAVQDLLATDEYEAVAVELCPSRYNAIVDPEALARMDLFEVLRSRKMPMVAASLALGAHQQRMAEQLGIEPGAEMRAAIRCCRERSLPVLLIDREIGVTLRRIYRNIPLWKRLHLFAGLLASVVSREQISKEEIELLKEGDILETTFSQFAAEEQGLFVPLVDERDRYMAARLRQELGGSEYRRVLAVIGAGHLKGITDYLRHEDIDPDAEVGELDHVPSPSRWPRAIPWIIVAVILCGFLIGFLRGSELGWSLVADWVFINGGLAALGALIAAAHPLTVVGAFLAAPLTSLNPTIGAGMVTAAIEIFLRKPKVADFGSLRADTSRLRGWWHNRVARTLLVFLFSTIGSAVGTYLAGFRIFDRLAG